MSLYFNRFNSLKGLKMVAESVEELDILIRAIEDNSNIKKVNYLTDGCPDDLPIEIREIVESADNLFISHNGVPNYGNINRSKYRINSGETDAFGWLSGVINTKKGKIVFG